MLTTTTLTSGFTEMLTAVFTATLRHQLYLIMLPSYHSQHVAAFEKDLCQLVEKLKEFTGLDIYGEILREKVEPYRLMVQARFPNSRINVEISRFRLWL
ncbi:unnamed protein product [Rotaria magnacalcarata]|uniref:Uncharacterized protein n=1 Tax=Rotaria magnacalcarata TaxID=392030 RepID=A0A817AK58_9BILA|nr:unnamed protein product [Rotaria magnacalcarata]CAF3795137.1 unnamed protein product [Rotaria magnacalcarata]